MTAKLHQLRIVVAAFVAVTLGALVLAGCGDDASSSAGNDADRAFVSDMVPHHQAAIDMAELAQKRSTRAEIKQLAADIVTAQEAEIVTMAEIKKDLGGSGGHSDHMGMSDGAMGMDGDMSMLRNAKSFDKAFIDMMIPHHEGAIRMARKQLADGELPELQTLSRNIIKAQAAEIEQMRSWRKQWYGSAKSESDNDAMPMMDMP